MRIFSVPASGNDANTTLKRGSSQEGEIPDRWKQILKKEHLLMSFKAALKNESKIHYKRHIVCIALWAFVGFYNSRALLEPSLRAP